MDPIKRGKIRGTVDGAGDGIVTIVLYRANDELPPVGADVDANWCKVPLPEHDHVWTVFFAKSNAETLTLVCDHPRESCIATKEVPNRGLPL